MDQNTKPGPARGLIRIHKAITRGITVGLERGKIFSQGGFPNPDLQKGYCDFIQSLGTVLSAHHLSEDDVVFPIFSRKIPTAPYERLAADHKIIEGAILAIQRSLPDLASQEPAGGLESILEKLGLIAAVWKPHIEIEETYFSETAIGAAMSPGEQETLGETMSKYAQEHTVAPFLAIPFVLYNLEGEDRLEMMASLPPVMIQELIPKEWIHHWAPMKPFFLT
jgi:hemerythrin-like domain-containing protein